MNAAEAIVAATARYDAADPLNIGSGQEISISLLAEKIATLIGFRGRIWWDTSQPNGQPRRCLDTTRAERTFGFRVSTGLEIGLRQTIAWYRENRPPASAVLNTTTAWPAAHRPSSLCTTLGRLNRAIPFQE